MIISQKDRIEKGWYYRAFDYDHPSVGELYTFTTEKEGCAPLSFIVKFTEAGHEYAQKSIIRNFLITTKINVSL